MSVLQALWHLGFTAAQEGEIKASFWLPLRFALREMRGGLHGFAVFIACIALGTMAISGIGSLAASLSEGLSREGQVILGGDLAFTLVERAATPQERAFLQSYGNVSSAATLRAMARTSNGEATLVELKAVDDTYPLFGKVKLDPHGPLATALALRGGTFGAVADPTLMARLNLMPGARLTIGHATFEIRAALTDEPDKLASGIGFGPRLMVSEAALPTTGLLQPGSLVHWHYRLRLPPRRSSDAEVTAVRKTAEAHFPQAGWDIRTRANPSPNLTNGVVRFTQFLTIVALTALLVGGVGVGNAVKSHLDRRREVMATLKTLGAGGGRVFAIYLTQVLILALAGGFIGLLLGAALPFLVAWTFGALIPLPIVAAVHLGRLLVALVYGLLTALAFALWPLGCAHDGSVGVLFCDVVAPRRRWPPPIYRVLTAAAVIALSSFAVLAAHDRRVAIIYVGIAAGIFLVLRLVAALIMFIAARTPHASSTALRLAMANIHRPGALTATIVLSLGLGTALLVTVIEVDVNLRRQFSAELPAKAPSFYFLDIPSAQAAKFKAFVHKQAPSASLHEVPMLRGRIISLNGVPAAEIKPKGDTGWVLRSDRGITYADALPKGSRLVAGRWWKPDYDGPPLVSFAQDIADGLGLKLGDSITVNVLGRNITARIASLRRVDWQSLAINFVMVFSSNTFRGAPDSRLATLTFPGGGTPAEEGAILRAVAKAYPTITALRVKEALEAIGNIVSHLVLAIRGASAITLIAAALVLGGALAASQRARIYDAIILKTLGATRSRLLAAYGTEYLLLGLVTALFGLLAGVLASWLIVGSLMHLPFTLLPWPAVVTALVAVLVTVALGLIGTLRALKQKPSSVLRNL